MDPSQKKEQFNIAYMRAIAAPVGYNPSRPEVDDDSIDFSLSATGLEGKIRSPRIEFQLKCTSRQLNNGDLLKFPLSLKNYNDLRGDDILSPRYLAVLVVPDIVDKWVKYEDDSILLRGKCYWVSLRYAPETTNTSNITVEIPLEQRLTKDSLSDLMTLASEGVYI